MLNYNGLRKWWCAVCSVHPVKICVAVRHSEPPSHRILLLLLRNRNIVLCCVIRLSWCCRFNVHTRNTLHCTVHCNCMQKQQREIIINHKRRSCVLKARKKCVDQKTIYFVSAQMRKARICRFRVYIALDMDLDTNGEWENRQCIWHDDGRRDVKIKRYLYQLPHTHAFMLHIQLYRNEFAWKDIFILFWFFLVFFRKFTQNFITFVQISFRFLSLRPVQKIRF